MLRPTSIAQGVRTRAPVLALLAVAATLPTRGSASEGGAPGALLRMPASVRASAMGEAYTASDDDAFGHHYNPAVPLRSRQASAFLQNNDPIGDKLGGLAFGAPTSWGQAAGSILYYDAGNVLLTDTSGRGRTVNGQRDILATASATFSPRTGLWLGANAKLLNSRLVSEFADTAYLVDLGGLYEASPWLHFALATQNLGTSISYAGKREDLPRFVRVGAAVEHASAPHRVRGALDFVNASDDSGLKEHFGVEYVYADILAARIGYKVGYESMDLSYGLGVTRGAASFDLAVLPHRAQGALTRVSMTGRF